MQHLPWIWQKSRLLSHIYGTTGSLLGIMLLAGSCLCLLPQNQHQSLHLLTDLQCCAGAKGNTSVLLCPWNPSLSFWEAVNTYCLWPELTISGHSQALEMMSQRDKVSRSLAGPGEQWSISFCPVCLRCRWAVTALLCLVSIWPPVKAAGCYGAYYTSIVSAGKLRTLRPSTWMNVDKAKRLPALELWYSFLVVFERGVYVITPSYLQYAALCGVSRLRCFFGLRSDSSDALCNTTLPPMPLPHIDSLFF